MNKKIKIAVNARFLISGKLEGIGTYSHQVLKRLVKLMPEAEFHFLFDREWSKEFIYTENIIPHKIGLPARHPFLWYLWFEYFVPNWLKKNDVDLFLSLDSFLSLKTKTKSYVVMHDLAFEHFPSHNTFLVRKFYKYFFPKYAKKASKIFAVSKFTKKDIIDTYNIDKNKIELAYCGVSEFYKEIGKNEKASIQNNLTESLPYFICIGSLNPRKNIDKVINAFSLFKETRPSKHKLVIVGAKGWKMSKILIAYKNSNFKDDIIMNGHLSPEILSKYLAASEGLIFPSLLEGFGIPVVEAFSCKVPVITSNVTSTKEIGENSSYLVDPNSEAEIKDAMISVVENDCKKSLYIENGYNKLQTYNWDKTALKFQQEIMSEIT